MSTAPFLIDLQNAYVMHGKTEFYERGANYGHISNTKFSYPIVRFLAIAFGVQPSPQPLRQKENSPV